MIQSAGFLVTGAAGFIGRRIVAQLLERGVRVIAFDRLPPPDELDDQPRLRWLCGDIAEPVDVLRAIDDERPRFVIHTAFAMDRADYIGSTGSALTPKAPAMVAEDNPALALRVNCGGMLNVLEAARLFDVERVVYTSAVAAFGSAIADLHPDPIGDRGVFAPDSVYGASKVMNEVLARSYGARWGIESVGLRIARTYGVGNPAPFTDFVRRIALGQPAELADPDYFNSYLSVTDCADAHIHACTAPVAGAQVFNVREGEYSNRDLAAAIRRLLPDTAITWVPGSDNGVRVPCLLTEGMADQLQWQASRSLEAGLAEMMNDMRANAGLPPLPAVAEVAYTA